jgi:diguanylate cyclase (GGDEF)-like protein
MTTLEIVLLVLLVISLATIGYIRRGRMRGGGIGSAVPDMARVSELVRSNCVDGAIQQVASRVSDSLINDLACDRILFLRKKRGALELNYYYNIRGFNRRDFRASVSSEMERHLFTDLTPRPIETIRPHLPEDVLGRIVSHGLDLYFPVLWRENLYGVYFVHSSRRYDDPEFGCMATLLAQSLASAYHVKWHESRLEAVSRRLESIEQQRPSAEAGAVAGSKEPAAVPDLTHLVSHRNSRTLVPEIISAVKKQLRVDRIAFLYSDADGTGEIRTIKNGVVGETARPPREFFEKIKVALCDMKPINLDELVTKDRELAAWAGSLKKRGLNFAAAFPLTSKRPGVLVFGATNPAPVIPEYLKIMAQQTTVLFDNAESYEAMEQLSYTDALTGQPNQRYFRKRLSEEINRSRRYGRNLALIFFDLDDMKAMNDTYGHQAGDHLLVSLGEIVRNAIRSIDILARYGGDEFCIIMPESDRETCALFMERLRHEIEVKECRVPHLEQPIRCTISLGGAIFPEHATDPDRLIYAADMALLRAKENGRNNGQLYTVA